jgi:hypothetical protein
MDRDRYVGGALGRVHDTKGSAARVVGKPADRRPAVAEGFGDDLVLERVLADAGEGSADFLGESIAEARFARSVVVLRPGDIGLSERRKADGPIQGAGCRRRSRSITSSAGRADLRS